MVLFLFRLEICGKYCLDSTGQMRWMSLLTVLKPSSNVSVLGRTLTPVFYRKMPLRLAKRLSAGFQDKESKPQVHIRIHPYTLKDHLKLVTGVGKDCRMKSGAKLS